MWMSNRQWTSEHRGGGGDKATMLWLKNKLDDTFPAVVTHILPLFGSGWRNIDVLQPCETSPETKFTVWGKFSTMGCVSALHVWSFTDGCVCEHISDTWRLVRAPFIYLFTALLRHVWPSMSVACLSAHRSHVTECVFYTPQSAVLDIREKLTGSWSY